MTTLLHNVPREAHSEAKLPEKIQEVEGEYFCWWYDDHILAVSGTGRFSPMLCGNFGQHF